jgi:hypothetical protein
MENWYQIKPSAYDPSYQGFNILTGSGTYNCDVINESTGSIWKSLSAVNGDAVLTAKSWIGQDLTSNGLTYDSGSAITILSGNEVKGAFTEVILTSGIIISYKV